MSQANSSSSGLTRRSFLKTTAVAAGAAAVAGGGTTLTALAADSASPDESAKEEIYSCACRGACNGGCLLRAHVRDGKVVKVSPGVLPDDRYKNRCCLKGLSHVQSIYDKDRVKYPMRRVGERGSGEWERITWDEAIKTITDTWKEEIEQNGSEALAFALGAGNCGNVGGNVNFVLPHALHAFGFSAGSDEAMMTAGTRAINGVSMGGGECLKATANLRYSKCIIFWGANVTNSTVQAWKHAAIAKENGAKIVTIDTCFTGVAAKSDLFIRIRPATDGALALGVMNLIFEKKLHDEEFIRKSTVGPLLAKESDGTYLRMSDLGVAPVEGPVDKATGKPTVTDPLVVWDEATGAFVEVSKAAKPAIYGSYKCGDEKVTTTLDLLIDRAREYPVEKVSKICDVPEGDIERLVDIFCNNSPSRIFPGFGLDHYTNGHYNCFSVFTLAAITGNFSKLGAGVGGEPIPSTNYVNANLQYSYGTMTGGYQVLNLPEMIKSGYRDPETKEKPLKLKSLFCMMTNWVGGIMGMKSNLEVVLNQLELHVVADLVMSDSAQYADIVLPVAHFFEQDDCACANLHTPFVMLQEKAIEPLYETKSDYEIAKLLLQAMGIDVFFKDMDQTQYLKLLLDYEPARALGITYDRLKEEKAIAVISPAAAYPKDGVFTTETQRFQWYFEKPVQTAPAWIEFDARKEQLPILYEPPVAALNEDIDGYARTEESKTYPLIVIQPHMRWRTHSTWAFNPWLRELDPEPCVYFNVQDAAPKGIEEGDMVRLFNDVGYVVLRAHINPGLRPGSVWLPKGWQRGQFADGHYQALTKQRTNNFLYNAPYFDVLVDVEKYEGGAE